jgi:flagellar biosynthesis protein FlhF
MLIMPLTDRANPGRLPDNLEVGASMNAKKFIAATSRDALLMVRNELGADAVILSNRKVDEGVEITALADADLARMTESKKELTPVSKPISALQTPAPEIPAIAEPEKIPVSAATPAPIIAEQQGILNEIKSMRTMMQEQLACMSWSDMQHRDPQRAQMLRSLLNSGFSPALSRQLIEKMPANADLSWVRQVLGNNLRVATQEEDVVVRGGVVALIGPTGVGKTTTTAKLAARAVVRYGADRVALITTDSYRVGAHEQLRIYGKILGVEVHTVRDTEDLRLTLSAMKRKHLVLIDTMGLGQRDSRVAEQTEMFNSAGVQRLLLLNATSGGDTLDDVVHKYHGSGVIGCIPTKLDEAGSLGAVLDVAVRHKLALHYITSGQRVPEDLHEVNLEYLLHRAFKPAAKATPFTLQELEFPALMAGLGSVSQAREAYAV